jgi:RnfABCDGE-type electron transport complex B subunit
MMTILWAIVVVGGIGLVSGAALAFASKKFAVVLDPRVQVIEEALPKANCGACGLPGCSAAAKAIVAGKAPVNVCRAAPSATLAAIAKVMGVEASSAAPRVAKIQCRGDIGIAKLQYEYHGIEDCRAAYILFNGSKACSYGCLALGSCAKVCPFGAIEYTYHHVPHVRYDKCTGCGVCVDACPRKLIDLYDASNEVYVMCKSHDKGGQVRKVCEVGCVACGVCERTCPYEAVTVQDGLAVIDHIKCRKCGLCVSQCPYNVIYRAGKTTRAFITDACNGCTICEKVCPVNAITGELKQRHMVDPAKCMACGICAGKCPKNAIEMREHRPGKTEPAPLEPERKLEEVHSA